MLLQMYLLAILMFDGIFTETDVSIQKNKFHTESFCPRNRTSVGGQILTWYSTPAGQMGISNVICADSTGWVRRLCKLDERRGKAVWSNVWRRCSPRYLTPNFTRNLYQVYRNSYETGQSLNVSDLKNVWRENGNFRFIDLEILVNSFSYLPKNLSVSDVTTLLEITADILNKNLIETNRYYNQICIKFILIFEKLLTLPKQFEIKTPNVFVTSWFPFRDNIIGFTFYKNPHNYLLNISNISQTKINFHHINVKNLEMAAYIPPTFLENLARNYNLTQNQKSNLSIIMIFAKKSPIYTDYFKLKYNQDRIQNFIGVAFPGFCKKNHEVLLRIFFNETRDNHWYDFGEEYFDSLEDINYKCITSELSYFAHTNTDHFESAKKDYCLPNVTITQNHSHVMYWRQTPRNTRIYQKEFCADEDLRIPSLKCNNHGIFENDFGLDFHCVNHTLSNITQNLYDSVVACEGNLSEMLSLFDETDYITHIDVKFYFHLLICVIENNQTILKDSKYISKAIGKGFNLVEDLFVDHQRRDYIANFFTYFFYAMLTNLQEKIFFTNNNLMYFIFKPFITGIFGLVIYNSKESLRYEVKFLTIDNFTLDYSSNDDVDVVVHLTDNTLNILTRNMTNVAKLFFNVTIAVMFRNKFIENERYLPKSNVIAVTYDSISNFTVEFLVYLKVNRNTTFLDWKIASDDKGLSAVILADSKMLKLIFVSQPCDDLCDTIMRITTYGVYKITKSIEVFARKFKIMDVISKLWIFLNPIAQDIYHKYYGVLRAITFTGSILSFIGVLCIILTALCFKGWRAKRPYTLQLTIAIACQTVYFIRDSNYMHHLEYLFFYYLTLSQFSWMLFIGYVQYLKFVKVFRLGDFGVLKPILVCWLIPFLITIIPVGVYRKCFQCKLCSKNKDIFIYFVLIPVLLVIAINIVIYIWVMVNISASRCQEFDDSITCARRKAAILLPFLLGLSWVFIFTLVLPWSTVILIGSFLFYTVTPLNGFVVFLFALVGDKSTRTKWLNLLKCKKASIQSNEISLNSRRTKITSN